MINGSLDDFIDGLYYGQEMLFVFKGQRFFVQGWVKDGRAEMNVQLPDSQDAPYVWQCDAEKMSECAERFLDAALWDGRRFYDVENEITWIDW